MTYEEFLTRYTAAVEDIKAKYNALPIAERRKPAYRQSKTTKRIIAERTVWAMQRKVSLTRLGITEAEARELAADGRVVLSPDRHRRLEAAHPRGIR